MRARVSNTRTKGGVLLGNRPGSASDIFMSRGNRHVFRRHVDHPTGLIVYKTKRMSVPVVHVKGVLKFRIAIMRSHPGFTSSTEETRTSRICYRPFRSNLTGVGKSASA